MSTIEPITVDARETIVPYSSHPTLAAIIKLKHAQEGSFWIATKFRFEIDARNFHKLPVAIQRTVKYGLAYFTIADEIIDEFNNSLLKIIRTPEIRAIYGFQNCMEGIHSETYNRAFVALIPDEKERVELKAEVKSGSAITAMHEWMRMWVGATDKPLRLRIAALGFAEGVMFSSVFAFIDWMKTMRYEMPDLYGSNHEISRDEFSHMVTAALVHRLLKVKCTAKEFMSVVDPGLVVMNNFIDGFIPEAGYERLTRDTMKMHARHCAHIQGMMYDLPGLYRTNGTPCTWMDARSFNLKDNFFEVPPVNYTIDGVHEESKTEDIYGDM